MPDQNPIIAATVKVDTSAASPNVKELNKNLKEVNTTLKQTGKEAATTSKEIGGAGSNFKNIKDQMTALPGPLGEAGAGVNKVSLAFKALLANPVVAFIALLVGVLTLLYKAFTNSYEGGQKMEQVFAGIKAAGQALLDSLAKIGGAIIKLFSFDFSGAMQDIKEVTEAAIGAYNSMSDLTKEAQKLHREQLANDLDAAKRAKDLAVLREQANDESVPLAKRKAALKELKEDAEKNAKEDIDLAKRTAENKIAQLLVEKDGARKNADEIAKIKIEQIGVETEGANELRRIGKQLTAAEKQELAERKANQQKADEAAKAERQKLVEFTNKLTKLQQDNELSLLKDGYAKELKTLENKIADEKRANDLAFKDKKITKQQQALLNEALDVQLNLQKEAIDQKHNEEVAKKESDFQKELSAIANKIKLDGITDARQSEKLALQIGYEEKLQEAITHYKDDQQKFQQIKQALDEQLKADQDKLDAKNKAEDDKKKFAIEEEKQQAIIAKRDFDFEAKIAAADAEQELFKQAFDNKVITELEYNTKTAALAEARKSIREAEQAHNATVVSAIGDAFETLSQIAGKQTLAGKALAIAGTTIKTFQSAVSAFAGMTETIPGPVGIALGIVAAAGAVATGIAAVKKIVAVQVPGHGGGGSAPTGIQLPAAPIAPTQSSTKLDPGSIDQISKNNSGMRAYVVEQDNADAARRASRLAGASVLGGG